MFFAWIKRTLTLDKLTYIAPLHTLSKLYDVPVGFVLPPPILRLNIAYFAVAEGWLLLDIEWFVLFLHLNVNLAIEILYQYEYVAQEERLNDGLMTASLRTGSAFRCKIK